MNARKAFITGKFEQYLNRQTTIPGVDSSIALSSTTHRKLVALICSTKRPRSAYTNTDEAPRKLKRGFRARSPPSEDQDEEEDDTMFPKVQSRLIPRPAAPDEDEDRDEAEDPKLAKTHPLPEQDLDDEEDTNRTTDIPRSPAQDEDEDEDENEDDYANKDEDKDKDEDLTKATPARKFKTSPGRYDKNEDFKVVTSATTHILRVTHKKHYDDDPDLLKSARDSKISVVASQSHADSTPCTLPYPHGRGTKFKRTNPKSKSKRSSYHTNRGRGPSNHHGVSLNQTHITRFMLSGSAPSLVTTAEPVLCQEETPDSSTVALAIKTTAAKRPSARRAFEGLTTEQEVKSGRRSKPARRQHLTPGIFSTVAGLNPDCKTAPSESIVDSTCIDSHCADVSCTCSHVRDFTASDVFVATIKSPEILSCSIASPSSTNGTPQSRVAKKSRPRGTSRGSTSKLEYVARTPIGSSRPFVTGQPGADPLSSSLEFDKGIVFI